MKKKSLIILFAVVIALMIFPILWQIQIVKDYKYEYEWRNEAYEQDVANGVVQDEEKMNAWLGKYKTKWVMQSVVLALLVVGEFALICVEIITIFPKILFPKITAIILLCVGAMCAICLFPQGGRAKQTKQEYNSWAKLNTCGLANVERDRQTMMNIWGNTLTGDIIAEISYGVLCLGTLAGVCIVYSERLLFYKNAITHKNFVKTEEKPTFYEELPDFDDAYNEILRKNEKQG